MNTSPRTARIAGLTATVVTALLAMTSPANAAVSCDVTSGPSPTVDISLTASGDQAVIEVDDFTYIRVNGAQCFDPAINAATTTTVDEVRVKDTSGGATEVIVSKPASFAPGDTSELGGTSEIEFSVDFGAGDDDLGGGPGIDSLAFANAGAGVTVDLANIQPQNTGGAGTDTILGLERASGSPHDDKLTAAPDASTVLSGQAGDDVLVGSHQGDSLIGGTGDDLLDDGGSFGSDLLDGDLGSDTITYSKAPAKVRINLAASSQNTFGAGQDMLISVENVEGSAFDDTLTGTADENVITGLSGADVIDGYTGPDEFRVRDGETDKVICGDGTDKVTADRVGVDNLTDCEATDFAPEPATPGQPGGDQPGNGTGNPTPPVLDSSILVRVGGSKSQRALRNRYITVTGTCPAESCSLSARPVLTIARKGRKRAIARTLPAVQVNLLPAVQRTLKVKLSKAHINTLKAARKRGARATITIAVTARDAAGNATTVNRKITLR